MFQIKSSRGAAANKLKLRLPLQVSLEDVKIDQNCDEDFSDDGND